MSRLDPRGVPPIALSSCFFAAMALVTRVIGQEASVGQLVLIRFGVGLLGTVALLAWRRERVHTQRPGLLAARGFIGALSVICYFLAIQTLGAGPATLLNYSSPIFATLFAFLFLGETVRPSFVVGLVVATLGASLVGWGTTPPGQPFTLSLGLIAGAASAVFSGAAVTSVRALRASTSALAVFFAFCVCGILFALPFALADWRPLSARTLGLTVTVGLLSLAAQLLFTYAFRFVPTAAGSVTMQLTPALSWSIGIALLDERSSFVSTVGAALCVGGVLLGTVLPARRRPVAAPGPTASVAEAAAAGDASAVPLPLPEPGPRPHR